MDIFKEILLKEFCLSVQPQLEKDRYRYMVVRIEDVKDDPIIVKQ